MNNIFNLFTGIFIAITTYLASIVAPIIPTVSPQPSPVGEVIQQNTSSTDIGTTTPNFSPTPTPTSSPTFTPTPNISNDSSISVSNNITASGEYSYLGQTVHYDIRFPKTGGAVIGTFNGICSGNIDGTFGGGNQAYISGNVVGECRILFVKAPLNLRYQGNVWFHEGRIKIEEVKGTLGNQTIWGRMIGYLDFPPVE